MGSQKKADLITNVILIALVVATMVVAAIFIRSRWITAHPKPDSAADTSATNTTSSDDTANPDSIPTEAKSTLRVSAKVGQDDNWTDDAILTVGTMLHLRTFCANCSSDAQQVSVQVKLPSGLQYIDGTSTAKFSGDSSYLGVAEDTLCKEGLALGQLAGAADGEDEGEYVFTECDIRVRDDSTPIAGRIAITYFSVDANGNESEETAIIQVEFAEPANAAA